MTEMCRYGRLWQAQGVRILIRLVTYQYFFAVLCAAVIIIHIDIQDEDLHDHKLTVIRNTYNSKNNII